LTVLQNAKLLLALWPVEKLSPIVHKGSPWDGDPILLRETSEN